MNLINSYNNDDFLTDRGIFDIFKNRRISKLSKLDSELSGIYKSLQIKPEKFHIMKDFNLSIEDLKEEYQLILDKFYDIEFNVGVDSNGMEQDLNKINNLLEATDLPNAKSAIFTFKDKWNFD